MTSSFQCIFCEQTKRFNKNVIWQAENSWYNFISLNLVNWIMKNSMNCYGWTYTPSQGLVMSLFEPVLLVDSRMPYGADNGKKHSTLIKRGWRQKPSYKWILWFQGLGLCLDQFFSVFFYWSSWGSALWLKMNFMFFQDQNNGVTVREFFIFWFICLVFKEKRRWPVVKYFL